MYSSGDHMAMREQIIKYFNLEQTDELRNMSLGDLEIEIRKSSFRKNMPKLASQSSSIGSIFYSIILAENERNNLRKIFAGKAHGMDKERIKRMLVL